MRNRVRFAGLICAVLLPLAGNAQVYRFTTPPPAVTAASADWQIRGEPLFYAGAFYYPTGPNVFFDGNVMARTGVFRGIPLYEDATLQPYSVVLVPIGGAMMRPYERRDTATLADYSGAIGTTGVVPSPAVTSIQAAPQLPEPTDAGGTIQSVPAPTGNRGIFVEFDGSRWYSAGAAVTMDPSTLRPLGQYHGFPVYADPGGARDRILIPAVPGGALTRYQR